MLKRPITSSRLSPIKNFNRKSVNKLNKIRNNYNRRMLIASRRSTQTPETDPGKKEGEAVHLQVRVVVVAIVAHLRVQVKDLDQEADKEDDDNH